LPMCNPETRLLRLVWLVHGGFVREARAFSDSLSRNCLENNWRDMDRVFSFPFKYF
jgi:hypothetical protein